ncbi:MAG: EAL domain-containing protein [bacterium LCO1.1]|uniref:EAL domain-containing protein n=1 Tax=Candidatus Weimeria bifida TaxID=2599074 RepID=A0A6N7IYF1_9FIRM|nr:EAL domain-containing protein [Candidatus Weimeria bifida]
MNIVTQCCGIALLIIIAYFYKRQKKVDLRSSRYFGRALMVGLVCLILDVVSVFAIMADRLYGGSIGSPSIVVDIICKLYLIALMFMAYFGFAYTTTLMPVTQHGEIIIQRASFFIYLTGAAVTFVVPIDYYTNGTNITFSFGPSCIVTYLFSFYFLIITFVMVLIYRKRVPWNITISMISWVLCGSLTAGIQFFHPNLLLVGFGTALGLFVLFLELENPVIRIDRTTGLFNLSTFQMYIEDFYKKDLQFSYIYVKIIDDLASTSERYSAIMMSAANYFGNLPHSKTFYDGQSGYIIVFRDPVAASGKAEEINHRAHKFCEEKGINFIEAFETQGRRADSVTEILELLGQLSVNGEYSDSNIIVMTDSMYERLRQERNMAKEVENAIAEDRIEPFFQPIYSTNEDAFTGAEALVRIRREDGSIVPPGMFIPVTEKTGQVTNIGDIMFEKTLDLIKNGGLADLGVKFIDINLSVLQCEDDTLSDRYLQKMREADVPPQMFCFEITETAMIVDRDSLLKNLSAFRAAGCSCSLDDFGNGESNLNYVVDMPINFIKADRSMVTKYTESSRVGLIMDSMIHMAKGLSLKVVAEGVETAEDLNAMENLNIDYIQGFYFSKPLPKDEYITFLKKNKRTA